MILLIETSVKTCSIALADQNKCIAFREHTSASFQHAELINVYIQAVLDEVGVTTSELTAVAISGGPGSYTGLRIGTSTAKGLCYALNIPLIAIDTLKGMADYFLSKNKTIELKEDTVLYPMIDARRLEVFTQKLTPNLAELGPVHPLILDAETFNQTKGDLILFGDGADKLIDKVEFENKKVQIIPNFHPSSRGLIDLAVAKFNASEFEDLAYFEPNYLKEFKAG